MQNVCLLKVANPSGAGPFGGVIAFQMSPAVALPAQVPNAAAPNAATGDINTSGGNVAGPSPNHAVNPAHSEGSDA